MTRHGQRAARDSAVTLAHPLSPLKTPLVYWKPSTLRVTLTLFSPDFFLDAAHVLRIPVDAGLRPV